MSNPTSSSVHVDSTGGVKVPAQTPAGVTVIPSPPVKIIK